MSRQGFSIERVVTLLTPFFAAAASFFTGWLSTKTGVHISAGAVEVIESSAFLGTSAVVIKWLNGRQIPSVAGLHVTPTQIAELHTEIETYLAAHSTVLRSAEAEIGAAVDAYLAQRAPSQVLPDINAITTEVLNQIEAATGLKVGRPVPATSGSPATA